MFFNLIPLEERVVLDAAMSAALGAVIYVNAAAAPGGDGDSWATAYNNLQGALNEAGSSAGSDRIWVAQGTYKPTESGGVVGLTFSVSGDTHIFGGFTGVDADRSNDPSTTVLSGDILGNDSSVLSDLASRNDNAKQVVSAFGQVSLGTLTIQDGYARVTNSFEIDSSYGGAISSSDTSPSSSDAALTLDNTILKHNVSNASKPFFSSNDNFIQTATIKASGDLTILNSTIAENFGTFTPSEFLEFSDSLTSNIMTIGQTTNISNSHIDNNSITQPLTQRSSGYVISAKSPGHELSITNSTISSNSTQGFQSSTINDSLSHNSYLNNVSFINNENDGRLYDFLNTNDSDSLIHFDQVTIEGTIGALGNISAGHYIIENSILQNNEGITGFILLTFNELETSIIRDNVISNNNFDENVLSIHRGQNTIENNVFSNNTSGQSAIFVYQAGLTEDIPLHIVVDGNSFLNNQSPGGSEFFQTAGVLFINLTSLVSQNTVDVTNNIFDHNFGFDGGAILATGASLNLNIIQNLFTSNTAENNGGAIALANRGFGINQQITVNISENVFQENMAGRHGGAIYIPKDNESNTLSVFATITDNDFVLNRAQKGDDIYIDIKMKTSPTVINGETDENEILDSLKLNNTFDRLDQNDIVVFG